MAAVAGMVVQAAALQATETQAMVVMEVDMVVEVSFKKCDQQGNFIFF